MTLCEGRGRQIDLYGPGAPPQNQPISFIIITSIPFKEKYQEETVASHLKNAVRSTPIVIVSFTKKPR